MKATAFSNPILANVVRGSEVESVHRGSAVVVDSEGKVVDQIGEIDRLIYPRSALKLLQAIPLVESEAADAFGLSERELSLACASHNAEPFHVEAVTEWLDKLGLVGEDLECGPTLPLQEQAAHTLIADHITPGRVHQNCSGKHTGMLTLCKHKGWPTKGYSEYEHPAQQTWMKTMGEVMELDIFSLPWERDGCGLPAVQMPLAKLALGLARFTDDKTIPPNRATAMRRILAAVTKYPEMIAGTDRCCTAVIAETAGNVVVKTGAEAVFAGCVPGSGLGFALKVDDGSTRGSEVALGALLQRLGVLDVVAKERLSQWFQPSIINSQGKRTGEVVASEVWT
ncbi:MAG: asparaginase [Acidiferrobacterales bacterium]|nr:asparaginase [Acidiferrobacterales bacterium]